MSGVSKAVQKLQLLTAWAEEPDEHRLSRQRGSQKAHDVFASFEAPENTSAANGYEGKAGDHMSDGHRCKCVLKPDSTLIAFWDVWMSLVLVHDLVVIPLELFGIEHTPSLMATERVASFTWMCDLVLSFFRGYTDKTGVVEMRRRRVARRYIQTWFLLDVCIVSVDLLIMFRDTGVGWMYSVKSLRVLRILRLARIFKVVKVVRQFIMRKELRDMLRVGDASLKSEKTAVIFSSLQQLFCLVVINHFVACGWYGIGTISGRSAWIVRHFDSSESEQEYGLDYRYFTSFHWAITQFTPASMEVHAGTSAERAYTIVCIFFGLVMFSSFVSSMTQSMTHLRHLSKSDQKQSQSMRRYIYENRVSVELASSIMNFLKTHRVTQSMKKLREDDFKILHSLPRSLLGQLHEEVYTQVLVAHGLFGQLKGSNDPLHSYLCQRAVKEQCLGKGDEAFNVGHAGESMYFCMVGRMVYVHYDDQPHYVTPGTWVSEAVLWTSWEHRGALIGQADSSNLLLLDAKTFHQHAPLTPHHRELRAYAVLWVGRASRACGGADYVTDIWGSYKEVDSMAQTCFGGTVQKTPSAVKKVLLALDSGEHTVQLAFNAWRDVKEAKSNWTCLPCLGGYRVPRNLTKTIKKMSTRNLKG